MLIELLFLTLGIITIIVLFIKNHIYFGNKHACAQAKEHMIIMKSSTVKVFKIIFLVMKTFFQTFLLGKTEQEIINET